MTDFLQTDLWPGLLAAAVAVLFMLPLRRLALRVNLVDRPGGRKRHGRVTPLVGGVAITLAALAGGGLVALEHGGLPAGYAALGLAAGLLLVCGLVDDYRELGSLPKFGVQIVAALVIALLGGQSLGSLGTYPGIGPLTLGALALPVTVVLTVGFVNAFNMMDGVDGLAGGIGLMMAFWLAVLAASAGGGATLPLLGVLMGAIAGFLAFNLRTPWRERASVFLGDAGSLLIGLVLAWYAIGLAGEPAGAVSPVAVAWVLALPVVDTVSLMIRRLQKGQSPFRADREHLHHIFLRAGYSEGQSAGLLILAVFVLGAIGVLGSLAGVPDIILALGLVAVGVLHFVFIRYAWRTVKALRRLHRLTPAEPPGPDAVPVHAGRPLFARRLALGGLYCGLFALPTFPTGVHLGGGLVLLATLPCLPRFWRDVRRLPLFWVTLALSVYTAVRWLLADPIPGGAPLVSSATILAIAGLPAMVLGWWIVAFKRHWLWLFLALVAGGAAGFTANADWARLSAGVFGQREAWGPIAVTGSLSAVALVMLLACCVSGLSRLERGWRPWFLLTSGTVLALPVLVVLVATRYTTGWLGALVGGVVLGIAVMVYGAGHRERLGSVIGALVLAGVGTVFWAIVTTDAVLIREAFAEPLQAAALYVGGEPALAFDVYPTTAERLHLWGATLERVAEHPWFGWGNTTLPSAAFFTEPQGKADYASLYACVILGFGAVGGALFAVVTALYLRELTLVGRRRLWSPAIVSGVLGGTAAMAVMMTLSLQADQPATRAAIVLLTAVYAAAGFERQAAGTARLIRVHSGGRDGGEAVGRPERRGSLPRAAGGSAGG